MSESEAIQQLRVILESIRNIGQSIEQESLRSDGEITETLKSGRALCDRYLGKPFDDSFNI
jgi:hypothetical protein